jgi:uncharacterized protein YgiM (DUF1202 family)
MGRVPYLLALVMLALVVACAGMQSRWEATKSADNISSYEEFLERHPESAFADQARLRLNELYEEKDWKGAEATGTLAAYENFINNHPNGRHKNDAYAKKEALALSMAKADDFSFNISEKLLKRYQRGGFIDEALSRLETQSSDEQAQTENIISVYDGDLNRHYRELFPEKTRLEQKKPSAVSPSSGWGTIIYPKSNTNIRTKRSWSSKLKGQLKTGQPIKVDFLQDDWYAVFPLTQKQRNLKKALGYVYAPFLIDKPEPNPSGSGSMVSEKKSVNSAPLKKISIKNESVLVDVKNIIFKVAGNGQELLFVEFDRFYTPTISGIEGKRHRIILEIKNASSIRGDLALINTGGNFIQQIRSSMDPENRRALIVLDMAPEKDYFVTQTFYKKDNMYSLAISEKKEIPQP